MIIKKLKETLLGSSKKVETQTSLLEQKNIHYTNKELKDSEDSVPTYVGAAAPVYLDDDPWFSTPIKSEKQIEYMEQEIEMKRQERENNFSVEPGDIHQKMYEIATKNQNTTLDLDPISPGGSENFHEGPGGWSSGNGMGQFVK